MKKRDTQFAPQILNSSNIILMITTGFFAIACHFAEIFLNTNSAYTAIFKADQFCQNLNQCYCSEPHFSGEEELYTQLVFFVQSILADRYIHRREL